MGDTVKTDLGTLERVTQTDSALATAAENFVSRGVLGRTSVPPEALEAIKQGNIKRDQAYAGNNVANVGYYLEPGLKFIVPQLTPFSNRLPRGPLTKDGKGIDTIRVRSVLDYFGGSGPSVMAGVLGQRGNPNRGSFNYKDLSFTAKQIAWSDVVTDEDIIYGEEFAGDVLQMAASALIPAWKQIEECWLINSSKVLWPPTAPIVTTSTTGGAIAAGSYWVKVTAYNANGETLSNPAVNIVVPAGTSTNTLNITLFSNPQGVGVIGYRVYVASGSTLPADSSFALQGASNYASGATPTQTVGLRQGWQNVVLSSIGTSGAAYSTVVTAANNGTNIPYLITDTDPASSGIPLTFDGMIATVLNNAATSNTTYGIGGLTPLVRQPANNGIVTPTDINGLLEDGFLNAHADYDTIFCSVKDRAYLTKLVAQASNTRIVLNANEGLDQGNLSIGYRVSTYLNPNTERLIEIVTLPYMQQGTLVFGSMNFPYPVPGMPVNPVRVGVNRELYSRVYQPDQAHQTQTTVTAFGNECFINQYIGGWAVLNGITGA